MEDVDGVEVRRDDAAVFEQVRLDACRVAWVLGAFGDGNVDDVGQDDFVLRVGQEFAGQELAQEAAGAGDEDLHVGSDSRDFLFFVRVKCKVFFSFLTDVVLRIRLKQYAVHESSMVAGEAVVCLEHSHSHFDNRYIYCGLKIVLVKRFCFFPDFLPSNPSHK